MKILILGGDGFCGWPSALHLAANNHEVIIVDNLERRKIDLELQVDSLTPIKPIGTRLSSWESLRSEASSSKKSIGKPIGFISLNVAKEYDRLLNLMDEFRPSTIVHFAEQRAAPYSMKSHRHKVYTVDNNVNATHNILAAMVESGLDSHLVHLGTMGVYGYDGDDVAIPEWYLTVNFPDRKGNAIERDILYPANPGSVYHMTKTLDQLLFQFYVKNDKLRITDLHQGIVWGTQTEETRLHPDLINRFDYDGDFGTVLNRFLMQAAVGYPLTVHGTGGQTRAFINIQDTVKCIRLAVENPPKVGDRVKVMNQMTETHRVRDLAKLVCDKTGAKMEFVDNPRQEADENDLIVHNNHLLGLGLNPITLADGLLEESIEIAEKYKNRCDMNRVPCVSLWRQSKETFMDLDLLKSAAS